MPIARVYKITSEKGGLVYIGSTVSSLSVRLSKHYTDMRRWLAGEIGKWASFQVLEYDDAKIEQIEELEVANLDELHKREGHYQKTMECINKKIAGRTRQEYRIDTKEHIKKHHDKLYQDNRETILAENKINHTCECGGHYKYNHKARHLKTKLHQKRLNQTETQRAPSKD